MAGKEPYGSDQTAVEQDSGKHGAEIYNVKGVSGHSFPTGELENRQRQQTVGNRRQKVRIAVLAGFVIAVLGTVWSAFVYLPSRTASEDAQAALPQVTVSKPLVRSLDTTLSFLGQFSAVDQVALRAQVGGTLTGIYFKDGDLVQAGDLLFTVDPSPYAIKLAEAKAELETANARLVLAQRELHRAQALVQGDAGSVENVDQRTADERAAQAAVDASQAQVNDAQFDIAHCRIMAPLTGLIGEHLVSIGNLIAGSRTASSPTTLLVTLVSLDPIHLDFDMSEADFLSFSDYRKQQHGHPENKVELALSNEDQYTRSGVLDFVDNQLDPSSGTIHARASIPNPDHYLTPGEFARLRLIVAPPAPTLLLPDDAVLPNQSEHVVLTVSPDGIVVPKQVEIGDMRGGLRVIKAGLSPGDQVIIDGIPFATPGAKVARQAGTIKYDISADQSAADQN